MVAATPLDVDCGKVLYLGDSHVRPEMAVRRLELQLSSSSVAAKRARLDSERQCAELEAAVQRARDECAELRRREVRRRADEDLMRVELGEVRAQLVDSRREAGRPFEQQLVTCRHRSVSAFLCI